MTTSDALLILDLTKDANRQEIETAYQQLFSRLNNQLTNAPTESLRNSYREKITLISQAKETLLSDQTSKEQLPASKPVTQINQDGSKTKNNDSSSNSNNSKAGNRKKRDYTPTFFIIALLSVAGAVWMGLENKKLKNNLTELEPKAEKLELLETIITNGTLVIINKKKKPFSLVKLKVFYLNDAKDDFIKFERVAESNSGNLPVSIKAGGKYVYEEYKGQESVYTGQCLFYSIVIEYEEGGYLIPEEYSGIIQNDKPIIIGPTE